MIVVENQTHQNLFRIVKEIHLLIKVEKMGIISSLKYIVKTSRCLNVLWQNVVCKIIFKINPKILANWTYKSRFNKNIDWDNPRDLIEKIYWLQFNTDTSLWTTCADKYLVREYIKSKGLEDSLNTVYGVYYDVDDIDWSFIIPV